MRCAHWVGPGISMATRFAFWRKIDEAALAEKHAQPGLLSDFILGSQDGLVNVLGAILGVAVASRDITIILAGGLAATFAESISMGAVAYTSTLARRDHYLAEVERTSGPQRDADGDHRDRLRACGVRHRVPGQRRPRPLRKSGGHRPLAPLEKDARKAFCPVQA